MGRKSNRSIISSTSTRQSAGITRRQALKAAGAGVIGSGLLGAGLFGGKPPAYAQERTLHVLEWSSFVPEADKEVDRQAVEFGKQEGLKVTVEHINNNDLNARATAAVESGVGPDIIQLWQINAKLFAPGFINHNDLVSEAGGSRIYKYLRDSVDVNGVAAGVPYFSTGAAYAYRKDYFQQAGATIPVTYEEFLTTGAKLKKIGFPVGQALGHSFGDPPGFCEAVLWAFGGRHVDEQAKVAINSKEARTALAFVKEFWSAACDEGGLAWDDTSNNRAFAASTISCTRNGASIYFVAKRNWEQKQDPLVKQIGHFIDPKGKGGNPHAMTPYHRSIFKASKVQSAAKNYIRFCMRDDNYEKLFLVNGGYINGIVPKWDAHPFWKSDANLLPYAELNKAAVVQGWPGPSDRRASTAQAKYILVDMFARAVKGDSIEEAISFAEKEFKNVYEG